MNEQELEALWHNAVHGRPPNPAPKPKASIMDKVRCALGRHVRRYRGAGFFEGPSDALYVEECAFCDYQRWL